MAPNSEKRIAIGGTYLLYGTGVKTSVDTNTSTVSTFDKVIPQGTNKVGHSIELSFVRFQSMSDYIKLRGLFNKMLNTPLTVSIAEDIIGDDGNKYVIREHYYNCLIDGKDYEIKAEERTVENVKFKSSGMDYEVKLIAKAGTF